MQRVHSMASSGFLQALAAKMVAGEPIGATDTPAKHDTVPEGDSSDEEQPEAYEAGLQSGTVQVVQAVLPTKATVAKGTASPSGHSSSDTHLKSHQTLDNGVQIFTYETSTTHSKAGASSARSGHQLRGQASEVSHAAGRSRNKLSPGQLGSPSTVDTASSYQGSPGSHRSSVIADSVKSFRTVSTSRSRPRARRNYTFREYSKRHVAATYSVFSCFVLLSQANKRCSASRRKMLASVTDW